LRRRRVGRRIRNETTGNLNSPTKGNASIAQTLEAADRYPCLSLRNSHRNEELPMVQDFSRPHHSSTALGSLISLQTTVTTGANDCQ